jgi:hypothetical protein
MSYQNYAPRPAVPGAVRTAGILTIIEGAFTLLAGLVLLALSSIAGFLTIFAVLFLAIGGFLIWTGIAVMQLKPWARMAAIVSSGIIALLSLGSIGRSTFWAIINIALAGVVIYMLFRPEAVAAFAGLRAGSPPQGYLPPPPPPPPPPAG